MKFQASSKNIQFSQESYNPGPGFYLGNDAKYTNILKYANHYYGGQDRSQTFGQDVRFNQNKNADDAKPGPGKYELQSCFQFKKQTSQNFHKLKQQQPIQPLFKVNAVPSIPNSNYQPGYQELGNGLLISIKDTNKNENVQSIIGPGTYDAKYDIVKKKANTTFIKSTNTFNTKVRKQKYIPDNPEIALKNISLKTLYEKERSVENVKAKETVYIKTEESKKPIIQNKKAYNIQLDINLNEEKPEQKKPEKDIVPSPGHYYDEKKASSFKIREIPDKFQCFDTNLKRFYSINKDATSNIGPCTYIQQEKQYIQTGYTFSKVKKIFFGEVRAKKEGEVNKEESKKDEDNQRKRRQKKQVQQSVYPSVFGSGTQRFNQVNSEQRESEIVQQSYSCFKQKQAKNKEKIIYISQEIDNSENKQDLCIVNNKKRKKIREKPIKLAKLNKQEYSFGSKIERFKEIAEQKIGPGTYDYKNDKSKIFNHSQILLDKVPRNLVLQTSKSVPRSIGPGKYDYDIDIFKKRITQNIFF